MYRRIHGRIDLFTCIFLYREVCDMRIKVKKCLVWLFEQNHFPWSVGDRKGTKLHLLNLFNLCERQTGVVTDPSCDGPSFPFHLSVLNWNLTRFLIVAPAYCAIPVQDIFLGISLLGSYWFRLVRAC